MRGWTAIVGALKYARAWLLGDRATLAQRYDRFDTCRQCSIMQAHEVAGMGAMFCGTPVQDRGEDGCGCLVGYVSRRRAVGILATEHPAELIVSAARPAGKVVVGSERCPRGKW